MSAKKDTQKKCERVLRLIMEKVNADFSKRTGVTLERDWGGNSLTVVISDEGHTHVGDPDGSFDDMLDSLIGALGGGGNHLSFADAR